MATTSSQSPRRPLGKRATLPPSVARHLRTLGKLSVVLFVFGTFTWRSRSATELSESPFDAAGMVRIAADCAAFAVAGLGLLHELAQPLRGRQVRTPVLPTALYGAYIIIAALGVLTAVAPAIVAFRVFELVVCLFVAASACRWLTVAELVGVMRSLLAFMAATIFVSAAAVPSLGLVSARGGVVPIRLEGVFPEFSANSVGFVGTLMFALSMTSARYRRLGMAVGLALIVLSQYRTGYVAVAACIVAFMLASPGTGKKLGIVLAVPLGVVLFQSAVFQEAWVRGEEASNSVATLSGRTDWWADGFAVAARSPFIGTGLSSGTRYEVLLGMLGNADASTIHGTWIELYVGTGLLGVAAMLGFVVVSSLSAWRVRALTLAPWLLMVTIGVRSLTGTSIELASYALLFFLLMSISARRATSGPPPVTTLAA